MPKNGVSRGNFWLPEEGGEAYTKGVPRKVPRSILRISKKPGENLYAMSFVPQRSQPTGRILRFLRDASERCSRCDCGRRSDSCSGTGADCWWTLRKRSRGDFLHHDYSGDHLSGD